MAERVIKKSKRRNKIDDLLSAFEENKKEREKEKLLSKLDGLYNLLITFSVFAIGLIVSQKGIMVTNYLLFYGLVGIIISMVFSFVLGVKGMMSNSMEYRLLSYCLLLTLPLWFFTITFLVISHLKMPLLSTLSILGFLSLDIVAVFFSFVFIKFFQKKFPILFEKHIGWDNIIMKLIFTIIVAFAIFWLIMLITANFR
jgi:hypothetical protein